MKNIIQTKILSDNELLSIIEKHKHENLTFRRLCEITGYKSSATMYKRIKALERQGKIRKRNIAIIEIL